MEPLTQEEIRKRICEQNDKVIVVGEYSGWDNGIEVQCKRCGRIYHAHISTLLKNHGCSECSHNRKLSTEEFIAKIAEMRDDIEVLGEYVNAKTPILCRCKICGSEFHGNPYAMLHNRTGCKYCSLSNGWKTKRSNDIVTKEKLLKRISLYSDSIKLVGEYTGFQNRNHFMCKKCGNEWDTTPASMCSGRTGCPKCAKENVRRALRRNKEDVLSEIYDINPCVCLAEEEYVDTQHKITATCLVCNHVWCATPEKLLQGHGCPRCANNERAAKCRLTLHDVKDVLQQVHPDWELRSEYNSCHDKIRVRCSRCEAEWDGTLHNILKQVNCPVCDMRQKSKGEETINRYLTEHGFAFERQKIFDGCQNVFSLKFDFYIPSLNVCIEYDGEQHFRPIEWFGGIEAYNKNVERDKIKDKFCYDNNIQLLRIAFYDCQNINNILDNYFAFSATQKTKRGEQVQ